jgi:hypothetical protein
MILAAMVAISCSKGVDGVGDSDPTPPQKPSKPLEVKISTADNGKNIFETMQFNVSVEGLESVSDNLIFGGFVLADHYDSLVWSIPDRKTGFKLFENGKNSFHFMSSFGHNFFMPGNIDSQLSGYRDGEKIYSYDLRVHVYDNKDFLCFNWADITRSSLTSTGYVDVFTDDEGWGFATSYDIHNGVPCIRLGIFRRGDSVDMTEDMERDLLFDEIGNLYGEPDYGDGDGQTDVETTEKYNSLFNFTEEDSQALGIWITAKSKVVLLSQPDTSASRYAVYAEPL